MDRASSASALPLPQLVAGWAALLIAGCVGAIAPGAGEPAPATQGEAPAAASPASAGPAAAAGDGCAAQPGALEAPLDRLTRDQFDNTVRDLFGDTSAPARAFPPDDLAGNFERGINASDVLVEAELAAAEAVAKRAVARKADLLPCDWAGGADACAARFVKELGPRIWRRPLATSDVEALVAMWNAGKATGADDGLALVIEAMMMSPDFLYHVEVDEGRPAGTDRLWLSDTELANRLAYFLWNAPPDAALSAAAARGELRDPQGLRTQAERLLADPKAALAMVNYHRQWLGLDRLNGLTRDAKLYPAFTAAHAVDLRASLEAQVRDWYAGDGTFQQLLAGADLFVNDRLAKYYGLTAPPATGFAKVRAGAAAGLIGHPGLVTLLSKPDKSDPIHRGLFVRTQLLCDDIPPPPPNVTTSIAAASPTATTRERYAVHVSDPACAACHTRIDPIGFGFEALDATGRVRTQELGRPVDDSGEIRYSRDVDGKFAGLGELARQLAPSAQVRECLAGRLLSYAVGQTMDTRSCAVAGIARAAAAGRLRDLPLAIVADDLFRTRARAKEAP